MLVTTGLLSLSIHDTLTFDGIEIALHPDLFAEPASSSSSRGGVVVGRPSLHHSGSSSSLVTAPSGPATTSHHHHHNNNNKPMHHRIHSMSEIDAEENNNNNNDGNNKTGDGGRPPAVSSANSSLAPPPTPLPNRRRLEVGDMIEIRVWDALETRDSKSIESTPRLLRRRRSPPPDPSLTVRTSASNSITAAERKQSSSSNVSAVLEAAASTLQAKIASSSTTSLQYSAESTGMGADTHPSPREGDNSTVSSTENAGKESTHEDTTKETIDKGSPLPSSTADGAKTMHESASGKAAAGIPPQFPRRPPKDSRSSAAASVAVPPKPSVVSRSRTAPTDGGETRVTTTTTTTPTRTRLSPSPVLSSSKVPLVGSHSRDISDMTLDTVFGGLTQHAATGEHTTTTTTSADLGIMSTDSQDETLFCDAESSTLSRIASTHRLRLSFVMLVSEKTLTSLKGSARTQVSLLRQIADLYDLSSYDMVTVNRIEKSEEAAVLEAVSADFVTMTFKEQFISRADMHYFQKSLIGRWIYEGERLINTTKGINAHAREIRHKKRLAKSGIITDDTMITFRSRSARIIWLVQISSEMWDYVSPYEADGQNMDIRKDGESSCEIYFDRFVTFMHRLFEKWKELEVTHSLTVIFFSRTFVRSDHTSDPGSGSHTNVDVYGRRYEDHFRVVIENETRLDWDSLIVEIKREFVRYPLEMGWSQSAEGGRRPSTAMQGNILEAVNVTLNLMRFHFLDRDLHRTGNSIVIVSPGCGVFEVDRGLAGITYQRMMDHGIGSDMLSLGLPPLHTAPFFHYNNDAVNMDPNAVDIEIAYHEIPHWMHLSFVTYDDATPAVEPFCPNAFTSRLTQDLEVAPNGFLISIPRDRVSQSLNTTAPHAESFSRLANFAASPTGSVSRSRTHQRKMISGRDFRDILEACCPRNSGYTFPSPLSALLQMRIETTNISGNEGSSKETNRRVSTESPPLKEWGAVDLDELRNRMISASRTTSGQSLIGTGFVESERSDSSGKSSPASSFASHFSSLFGRSPPAFGSFAGLHARGGAHVPVSGIQIQRSPSLEMEGTASTWLAGNDADADPHGAEQDQAMETEDREESDIDQLSKLMRRHDEDFFARNHSRAIDHDGMALAAPPRSPSSSPILGSIPPPKEVSAATGAQPRPGGLGAALSQYQNKPAAPDDTAKHVETHKKVQSSGKLQGMGQVMGSYGRPHSLGQLSTSPFFPIVGMPIESEAPQNLARRISFRDSTGGHISSTSRSIKLAGPTTHSPPNFVPTKQLSQPSRQLTIHHTQRSRRDRSPSTDRSHDSPTRDHPKHHMRGKKYSSHRSNRVLNPFKQKDEDEVLAEKSHNRRRWSHVFPLGEIEFKRNAGPNWKSLCQPAILPLTIDYFPTPQELKKFQFSHWTKTLSGTDSSKYTSHKDLLMEMVRQRLIQDYQVVPPAVVRESRRRGELELSKTQPSRRLPGDAPIVANRIKASHAFHMEEVGSEDGVIEHVLSMGHVVHRLSLDDGSDSPTVNVVQYNARISQSELHSAFNYHYYLYSPLTEHFTKTFQSFKKYGNQYLWSRVDTLICDGEYNLTSEDMRFRRVMYALIPPVFKDLKEETEYIGKFHKLKEYLCKLTDEAEGVLDIRIVSSECERADPEEDLKIAGQRRRGTTDTMTRFTVRMRKGKRDPYEWMEIAADSTFDTKRSYRIMFHWLVASTSKVETQVQLLQRRCSQFGLKLTFLPQISVASNVLLNPLIAPLIYCVRDKERAEQIAGSLLNRDFVDDGIYMTEPEFLQCVDDKDEFDFPLNWRKDIANIPARQFVHRSGSLFVRLMIDQKGWAILTALENRTIVDRDNIAPFVASSILQEIVAG